VVLFASTVSWSAFADPPSSTAATPSAPDAPRLPSATGARDAAPPEPPPGAPDGSYWNARRTVGAMIGLGGVGGVVVGAVFGANRAGDTSDAAGALASARAAAPQGVPTRSVCTNPTSKGSGACAALSSSLASNGTDADVEDTLLVGGGLLLVVGLLTTFWPEGPEMPPMNQLAPLAGPHVAGLSWSGSF
jgi:hypothetical protein